MDKIKGGWSGQTIGVVYGAQTEFKYQGAIIPDYQPITWRDGFVKYWWIKKPGLFDDVYNDLTFVEIFEKYGMNVPADTIAHYFAYADYHLAHANQAARYNIRQGIMPPASGNWKNNPHADDLDFQIDADFIGLMNPGMVNKSIATADKVGHIMNSGDGYYGGVFVAALYSMAFISHDVNEIVNEAVKAIPDSANFRKVINDVIAFHQKNPTDWKACWFEIQKKWNRDIGCPKGTFLSFNIDAKMNSAHIALALLYGNGDFAKTVEIAVRCGDDTDSNCSNAGGVLGTMLGYSNIPAFWLNPLKEVEALNFEGTDISLNKGCELSYKHALAQIASSGGKTDADPIVIPIEKIIPAPFEQNFPNMFPVLRDKIDLSFSDTLSLSFAGNGFVLYGNLVNQKNVSPAYVDRISKKFGSESFALGEADDLYVAELEVYIDNVLDQTVKLPMKNTSRRLEPAWKYLLKEGNHSIKLKWLNSNPSYAIRINDLIVYSEKSPTSSNPQ